MLNKYCFPRVCTAGILVAFMVLTGSVLAQNEALIIETISVENAARFKASIIVSESLLMAGDSYTEVQLRDAIRRVNRLPFILGAEFTLHQNAASSGYELVISVRENQAYFVGAEELFEEGDTFKRVIDLPNSDSGLIGLNEDNQAYFAGYQVRLGDHGVLWGAGDPLDSGRVFLRHSQYNLLDRDIRLEASFQLEPIEKNDRSEVEGELQAETYALNLRVPLVGNHSLNLESSLVQREENRLLAFDGRDTQRDRETKSIAIAWIFNTLDDEVLTNSGRRYRAALGVSRNAHILRETYLDLNSTPTFRVDMLQEIERLELSGVEYWTLSDHQSLFASLNIAVQQWEAELSGGTPTFDPDYFFFDNTFDEWEGELAVGHSLMLYKDLEKTHWRQLRWETVAAVSDGESHPRRPFSAYLSEGYEVRTALKFRSSWAVIKMALSYFDREYEITGLEL